MKKGLLLVLSFSSTYFFAQETKETTDSKEKQIKEVVITKTKKAVEQKADRTIFDFSEQPSLNSSSVLEGMKKLPGLIVSDVAGMMYQGKILDVYQNGRPLNITTNELTAYLESMPANSVDRIEVITQPGAEFPATSGGAILNIITNSKAKNYLSATYSGRYSVSNYDKLRHRTNHSILLNAKNQYFSWQLNVGQNYREAFNATQVDDLSGTYSDRFQRNYFAKSALTFDFDKDKLLFTYDANWFNNTSFTDSNGVVYNPNSQQLQSYISNDRGATLGFRHEASAVYQKRFDDKNQKLDFSLNYNQNQSSYDLFNRQVQNNVLENFSDQKITTAKIDYSQPIKLIEEGKISLGVLYDDLRFEAQSRSITNLDYSRKTAAAYAEVQTKWKKFDFILGTRAENYDIQGTTTNSTLIPFKKFRLFPNASVQYNLMKDVYINANYNNKIQLPNIGALNPNNTNYQNANISFGGNPNLQPTIFNNFEIKVSAFDYAFISYSQSRVNNQVINYIDRNGLQFINGYINQPEMKIHNFSMGLPVPYMLFTKGLAETMKFNFNPDKINFMYIYTGYQLHEIPNVHTKGFWIFNIMSQFILPKDFKFVLNYSNNTLGNYYYFLAKRPFNHSLDLTLSRKFLNDRLNVSVFANDVLKTNRNAYVSQFSAANVAISSRFDSQNFGLSINYKIPTKNKNAKETPILVAPDKTEDSGGIMK